MQYQVFVQSHPENKFIASIVGIPNTTVEGSTKEEVILTSCTTPRNRVSYESVKLKPLIYRLETRFLSPC